MSMFLLLDRIGPPPTLRPSNTPRWRLIASVCLEDNRDKCSPLDSLDDGFPSLELEFLLISFEYPDVVRSPARVVVASSLKQMKMTMNI